MPLFARLAALLIFLPLARPSAVSAETYDIYLLAGQSNMDGRGQTQDLAESVRRPSDTHLIFYRNSHVATERWQPLAPGFSRPPRYRGALPAPTFGPEIGFALAMTEASAAQRLALIKGSQGGTSLRADWTPGTKDRPDTQGPQYRDFLDTVRQATGQLTAEGHQWQIRGLLWHQGESDSRSDVATYRQRLAEFLRRLREDLDQPDLPVVLGEVYDNGKRDSVRTASHQVAAADANTNIVSAADTISGDGTHFDADSQLLLGRRYAQQMRALLTVDR